jgi:hypothetical protein
VIETYPVQIKTFAELITPDVRTLTFTPWGLSTMGSMSPEDSARFQQETIAAAELKPAVPEATRKGFDRIRLLHSYGVLCYELFTTTDDLTWVVLEHALRERFVAYYESKIPFVDKGGNAEVLETTSFDLLAEAFRSGGKHAGKWLELRPGEKTEMPLTLDPLLRWAHEVGVLNGQVNKKVQLAVFGDLRNHFAHGSSVGRIGMPVDSTLAINDMAEIINRMWGFTTRDGRLYPSSIPRHPIALAWNVAWPIKPGAEFRSIFTQDLAAAPNEGWTYVLVLMPDIEQRETHTFDARYDTTSYPMNYLWGPGTRDAAIDWLAGNQPTSDEIEPLDRLFLIRRDKGKTYLAIRPGNFLGLPHHNRRGTWKLIMADFPNDAYFHVRHLNQGQKECPDKHGCRMTVLKSGTWSALEAKLRQMRPDLTPEPYLEVGVPRQPYPDDVGY